MEKLALIAGFGELPLFLTKKLSEDFLVYYCSIKEEANISLDEQNINKYEFSLLEIEKLLFFLKSNEIKNLVFAGKFQKVWLLKQMKFDSFTTNLLSDIKKQEVSDINFINIFYKFLEKQGFNIINPYKYLEEYFTPKGQINKVDINSDIQKDIEIGKRIAKHLANLEVGQSVIVKDKIIVGVEALEGTDELIRRCALLCGSDWVLVKMARDVQTAHKDIPGIGEKTIENAIKYKGKCIALEAGKSILINKNKLIDLSNKNNIALVGI